MRQYRIILIALLMVNSVILSQTTISIGKVTAGGPPVDVLVPVNVSAPLNNVKSISLQFSYDKNTAEFKHDAASIRSGIANFALADINNLFVSNHENLISLSWTNSNSTTGVTLNGKIFDLDFHYLSDFSEVRFVSAVIKDMQGKKLAISFEHGSISQNTDPAIKLIFPNGGETLEVVGTPANIAWTGIYISNVNLEYSTDNGNEWNTIINNYEAAKDSYLWTIPGTVNSGNCKLKITDADSSVSDESDAVFTINSTPVVTLTTPNGAEELQVGGVKTIKWNCRNIGNIKLEYSLNAAAPAPAWQTIAASIPAHNQYYEWIIPDVLSSGCKIKITDAANSAVFDLSDAVFSIHNNPINVEVSSNVEAKVEIIGKVVTRAFLPDQFWWWKESDSWHCDDAHYSEDGVEYDAKDTLNISGTVHVSVGWLTSLQYLEMRLNYDPEVLILESLIPVAELKTINYSYENGVIHVVWGTSDPIDIHGKIFDLKFRYVKFNNPLQWLLNGWDYFNHPAGDPNIPTAVIDPRNFSDIKIEMVSVKNSRNNLVDAGNWSNGILAISNRPAVKLLSPADSDTLEVNDETYDVLWASRLVNNVTLQYSTNNGVNWNSIITTPAASGTYSWTLPNVNSAACLFKISDASDNSINDVSSAFTITNLKSLNLTSPDGGEIFKTGTTKTITWLCRNIDIVKLEYSINTDTTWNLITDTVQAKSYKYTWIIPGENSAACKVRIRDLSDTTLQDLSTAVFTINNSKTKITIPAVVSPAGVINVPVNSEQVNGAAYFNFSIKFDTAVMELDNVVRNPVISSGQFNYLNDNGIIRVVWFSTTPVDFSGDLFIMKFKNYSGANSVFEFDTPSLVKDAFNKILDIELINGSVGLTDVKEENIPANYSLMQNYPNPFNPGTTIRYEIPEQSHVVLTIYNMLGEKIITLLDEIKKPGYYNINWIADNCPSGIYYYSIVAKEFIQTKKMILLK